MPTPSQASLLLPSCAAELDAAVTQYNKGNTTAANTALQKMMKNCSHLPQLHHNLGVVAANRQHWPEAERHFRDAIKNDTRTQLTLSQLQSLHQHQASLAYQSVIGVKKALKPPAFEMQNSTLSNQSVETPPKTQLHSVSTVDYELYSWWSAAAENAVPAWLEHYSQGYPPLKNDDASVIPWQDIERDISFTAQDAVVVLSYQRDDIVKRTLLLLRLQNNRWKIYRETAL